MKPVHFLIVVAGVLLLRAASPQKPFSSYDALVKPIVAKMTLDEKIGQMTQPDQEYIADPADVATLFLGSVLSGGSSDPKEGNSLAAWTNMYDRFQQQSLKTRLRIPILYGVDAVHGHNNVIGAVVFPHNIGMGATRDPALVEKAARVTAEEVRATGIQWTFAPGVMVPQDPRWGRTYEGFSDNPDLVKVMGEAAVRGFQGNDLSSPLSVLACAKHFVGDGGTAFGSAKTGLDQGDMKVDEATLRRVHLPGYVTAIKAGVGTIMPSYSSWNGVKCSGSRRLLTDILKGELGFEGFLISDYDAVDQITPNYKDAIGISINAGMDMVMVPRKYKLFLTNLKALVAEGTVPMSRIDDAVTRILRVKAAMGLLDPNRSPLADRKLQSTFGSAGHRMVARQAVRESLVLLKNQDKTLPLKKSVARIHVAGRYADDIGAQCGGWTIDWQGKTGNITTGGTTLLAAIKKNAANVTYSADGAGAKGATLGIVVIGEKPYAEMQGDRKELSLAPEDIAAVDNMKAAGIPVVAVLFSGRPMTLGTVFDKAAAIVAAWLPGTEGDGITDVLFGAYKPKGKLPYTWEKQFAFGFGLTW